MRNRTKLKLILVSLVVQLLMLTSLVMAGPQDYQSRPIPMGVSISTTPTLPYISAGTAGMRVKSLFVPGYSSCRNVDTAARYTGYRFRSWQ